MTTPDSVAAQRFEHQLEMLLKDNYDLNDELYQAWAGLKEQSAQPAEDYAALIEWLCDRLREKAKAVMADEPIDADDKA